MAITGLAGSPWHSGLAVISVGTPVTSWSRVSRLALVAQQLPLFTQVAGGAETIVVAKSMLLLFLLKLLMDSVALSQRGEREEEEEEEERTEAS